MIEPRLVRQRGVAGREVDQAALLTALRHDDANPPPGPLRQPRFERLAFIRLGRHVDVRWRDPQLVELLQRRLEHLAVA